MIKKIIVASVAVITFSGFGMASPARALVDPVSIAVALTVAFTSMVTVSEVTQNSDTVQNVDASNTLATDSELPAGSSVSNFN